MLEAARAFDGRAAIVIDQPSTALPCNPPTDRTSP
jgi:hypothetical protein